MPRRDTAKHVLVYRWLRDAIESGRFGVGARLPRETELMRQFDVSRITVTRAMRDLQAAGLVDRRVGAGSFVARRRTAQGYAFGLLIPDLGITDLFEPLCQGMMASPLARDHVLLWGAGANSASSRASAHETGARLIDRGVAGVFFAPLEFGDDRHAVNAATLDAFDRVNVPVVLLDRAAAPYPEPGRHDLVALDNRRAGYVMTQHLLAKGCTNVAFIGRRDAAASVDAREAGYREALQREGRDARPVVHRPVAAIPDEVDALMRESPRPDGIVGANDRTAGEVAHALGRLGYRIPDDVRLVGIDDVGYAELLPVPLTTYRQPVEALGDAAMGVMLDRVARPDRPSRDTLLHGRLIVRASCGG